VIGIAAAEALVSHLIVERNGSDFLVRWHLHTTGNVTNIVLVWCASRSSLHGCEVFITCSATCVICCTVVVNC